MSTDQNEWIPSTDLVRDRYYSATVADDTPEWWMDRNRHSSDAEFNRWLEDLKAQLREEIQAEESGPSTDELLQRADQLRESWKQAERPFSDSDFDSDDSLAVLHAVGALAVHEIQALAKALQETQQRPVTPWIGGGEAKSESVADIYATNPYSPIILNALDHRPGEHTSEDFQRGYFAALTVTHIKGAAALDQFSAAEWEYGWRSFFSNGEEYEWLSTHSREDAEQQIRDFQEEEDRNYANTADSEGKLTYSLWRRLKSKAGAWERVEETTDEQH